LRSLEDQKAGDYLDPEFETLNAELYRCRTVIQDFPTLVIFMYDLLPRSWSDESALESIAKPKKWKSKKITQEQEAEFLVEREKAFLLHRSIIFRSVVEKNFVLFPGLIAFLEKQRMKYCRPGVNYYMPKEETDALKARFRNAWEMVVNKPIALGQKTSTLGQKTTTIDQKTQRYQRRNRMQTIKEAIDKLRLAGCNVNIPVIDLEGEDTPIENPESNNVLEAREESNLEMLAKHYTSKPDHTDEFPVGKCDLASFLVGVLLGEFLNLVSLCS
jgi:hypothetical protein